jgi:hypothetical protein
VGIAFCRVNRRGQPDYRPNRQRHHLLPVALFRRKQFRQFFMDLMAVGFEFDDFPTNGVLLPTTEAETLRCGLPLHRGPHPRYNALILMRAENIRAAYARSRRRLWDRLDCLYRLRLLQCRAAGAIGIARLSRQPSSARSDACGAGFRNHRRND